MNMKQIFISIALILVLPIQLIADDSVQLGYSEAHREGKQYFFAGQPIGLGPIGFTSNGLSGGLFLDRNSLFVLTIKSGKNLNFFADWPGRFDLKYSSISVNYKKFVNTSFYINSAGEFRKIDYSRERYSELISDYETSTFTGSAVALNFAIGNQWQWDSFTLGCDWAGISIPIASRIDTESKNSSDTNNLNYFEDDKNKYMKNTTGYFVQFYLGASF